MAGDILQALKESIREHDAEKNAIDKVAILRRCLLHAADLLDIVLDIQRGRRYRRYDEW